MTTLSHLWAKPLKAKATGISCEISGRRETYSNKFSLFG